MALLLPVIDAPRQSFIVRLAGQEVKLLLWYQPGDEAWYASLEYPVNQPLVSGRRLVSGGGLLADLPTDFSGDIVCLPLSPNAGEPARDAWGVTHRLAYLEA